MIARNYFENGADLLHPTINMAGEKTGIIGSEFPFFNYLIYLFSQIFGYTHWSGRLINLVISSIGLFYFFKLIKGLVNRPIAFNSTIVLAVSIWFAFSRKIMPDTFSVALLIIGLYHAHEYLRKGKSLKLILFFVLATLGLLCKIPSLSLFSVLILTLFIRQVETTRKILLLCAAGIAFLTTCLWYFYWVPHLLNTYKFQLYFPKSLGEGMLEIFNLLPELLEKFYFSALHSYSALLCCLVGLVILVTSKQYKTLLAGVITITIIFCVFILKTGAVFPLHNYYIIPFVPIMALLAGIGINQIKPKIQYLVLGIIAIESIANQQHDFWIKDSQLYKLELENLSDKIVPKQSLIVINGGPSPQDMYFTNRKGWTVTNEQISNINFLDSLANLGVEYLIVDKHKIADPPNEFQTIYEDEDYQICQLPPD